MPNPRIPAVAFAAVIAIFSLNLHGCGFEGETVLDYGGSCEDLGEVVITASDGGLFRFDAAKDSPLPEARGQAETWEYYRGTLRVVNICFSDQNQPLISLVFDGHGQIEVLGGRALDMDVFPYDAYYPGMRNPESSHPAATWLEVERATVGVVINKGR